MQKFSYFVNHFAIASLEICQESMHIVKNWKEHVSWIKIQNQTRCYTTYLACKGWLSCSGCIENIWHLSIVDSIPLSLIGPPFPDHILPTCTQIKVISNEFSCVIHPISVKAFSLLLLLPNCENGKMLPNNTASPPNNNSPFTPHRDCHMIGMMKDTEESDGDYLRWFAYALPILKNGTIMQQFCPKA